MAAQDITSKGLMGLPHYTNSRVSMAMDEPLYQNIFTVQIQLPVSMGVSTEDTNYLLEGVKNVQGLQTHTTVTEATTQSYKYAQRSFAGAKPGQTYVDFTIDFEVNLQYKNAKDTTTPSMKQVKMLRQWCDLVYDPLTGRTGLKKEYTAPMAVVTMQDRAQNSYWQWICYDLFPITQIPAMDPDYNKTDLYKVNGFKLRCDRYDEIQL